MRALFRNFYRKFKDLRRRRHYREQLPALQARAQALFSEHGDRRPAVLFASGMRWEGQVFQRPQQLARALARTGALVFYIEPEPIPAGLPFEEIEPGLVLCRAPIEAFSTLPAPWVYLLTWSLDPSPALDRPRVIYDVVDHLSAFSGDPRELKRQHQARLKSAALALASAPELRDAILPERPGVLLLRNAVDLTFMAANQLTAIPEKLQALRAAGRPIVGYTGALARWVDFSLIRQTAQLMPLVNFLLVGPDLDGSLARSNVLECPNVHWLGQQPYTRIPAILASFEAAWIPFIKSELTDAVSPIKLYEYLAAGLPVVAVPIAEALRLSPPVLLAATPAESAAAFQTAFSLRRDPQSQTQLNTLAQANTWEARAQELAAAMLQWNANHQEEIACES